MTDQAARYKFQRLQVYQLGLDYVEAMYALTQRLPRAEDLNLRSQLQRAATSIVLNIAEGSTSQSDAEQARFLGLALRSLMECVACLDLIERHNYLPVEELTRARELGHQLFVKIQAMRRSLDRPSGRRAGPRSPVGASDERYSNTRPKPLQAIQDRGEEPRQPQRPPRPWESKEKAWLLALISNLHKITHTPSNP